MAAFCEVTTFTAFRVRINKVVKGGLMTFYSRLQRVQNEGWCLHGALQHLCLTLPLKAPLLTVHSFLSGLWEVEYQGTDHSVGGSHGPALHRSSAIV